MDPNTWQSLWPLLNFLATLIAGLVALIVYFRQRNDNKRDSAKTILSEITTAERIIKEVKDIRYTQNLPEIDTNKYILGDSSWMKNKYLFINDFDANEWEKINTFFRLRDGFNKTIIEISNILPRNIEYRTKVIQEELAKLATAEVAEIENMQNIPDKIGYMSTIEKIYEGKAEAFKKIYIHDDTSLKFIYNPVATFEFLAKRIDEVDIDISISSVGIKLRKIIEKRKFLIL